MKAEIPGLIRCGYFVIGLCLMTCLSNSSHGQSTLWSAGNANTIGGEYSIALGMTNLSLDTRTTASGNFSLAIGYGGLASGQSSLSLGYLNQASGIGSTAIGFNNFAFGKYSTAIGTGAIADGFSQFVVGTYNLRQGSPTASARSSGDHLFIIGNGTGDATALRGNAMVVKSNGDLVVTGNVTAAGVPLLSSTAAASAYMPINNASTRAGFNSSAGLNAIALGNNTNATNGSVAVGHNIFQESADSAFFGRNIYNNYFGSPGDGSSNLVVGIGVDTYGASNMIIVGQNIYSTWTSFNTIVGHASGSYGFGASVFGYANYVSNEYGTAVGAMNSVGGKGAAAIGYSLYADSYGQVALGYNNKMGVNGSSYIPVASDDLLTLGNGASPTQRSNALVVKKNGAATLSGVLSLPQGARVSQRGDISMGQFTAGAPPAP